MIKNYYEILEVHKFASDTEIKRAFYKLAKKYHPDINPKTANLFKEINEAYHVLIDPKLRREYNNSLNTEVPFTLNEDIFKSSENDSLVDILNNVTKQTEDLNKELEELINSFDYFEDGQYYYNPEKESIFRIIDEFKTFRFENAVAAIWNRNAISIFGAAFVFLLSFICILFTKPFKLYKHLTYKKHNFAWLNHISRLTKENKLFFTLCWTIILNVFSISRLIYNILYSAVWIFSKILKYFLIPAAIILAASLRFAFYNPTRR